LAEVDNVNKIEKLELAEVDNVNKIEKLELAEKRNDELEQEIVLIKNSNFYNTGQYVINFVDRNFPINSIYGKIIRKILMKIFANGLNEKIEQTNFEFKYEFDESVDEPIDEIKKLEFQPKISIIMPVFNTNIEFLKKAIDSVKNQYYSNWQLCICDDASTNTEIIQILKNYASNDERICVTFSKKNQGIGLASNTALEIAEGEFTVLLDHDDTLSRNALLEIVKVINMDRSIDYIYSDEDKIDEKGFHVEPFFKPDWSPNMFFSYNYPIHVSVFQTSKLNDINGFRKGFDGSQDYDLILRYLEHSKKIKHIPKILYSWRKNPGSTALRLSEKDYAFNAGIKAISDALSRRKIDAVCVEGIQKGTYRVQYKINDLPLVSIIVPTKNLENLKKCIKSIFKKSTYQNFEIIVLDTSLENKIEKFCDISKVQHLKTISKKFNFSKINNDGVKETKGKYIIFLNDDTEVISPEWIECMLEHAQRDEVGIVGAKLLFKNDLVQHAGTIVGIQGHAGNYGMMHKDEGGNFSFAKIIRDYSAVTAACMMISKELFEKIDGYDEKLANSWQDVDLCLRVMEMNKGIIFTPYSLLYHYEGATRGKEDASEEEMQSRKIFREKHKKFLVKGDPHYNPNLSSSIPFALSPKLIKPKKVIAELYQRREDLRKMFPTEQKNDFKNIIDWAVTHGIVIDGEKYLLEQYYDYYYDNCSENAKKIAKKIRMYLHSKELQEKFPEVFEGRYDDFLNFCK